MTELDIAEVARRSRLPASTLRYYEERGLIKPLGRRGLRRVYSVDVLERLALIALGQACGFALDEVASMFGVDGQPRIERERLLAQAELLQQRIAELQAMRDGLLHAAACPAPRHMECPTFLRIVRAAAQGRIGARRRVVDH